MDVYNTLNFKRKTVRARLSKKLEMEGEQRGGGLQEAWK